MVEPADVGRVGTGAGKVIQQFELRCPAGELNVFVLPVNVDQLAADLAQQCRRHGNAVDEGAGAALSRYHSPYQAQIFIVARKQIVRLEARLHQRQLGQIKLRAHVSPVCSRADRVRARPITEQQAECGEHDRFARAGLAGNRRQPRAEIYVQRFDQQKVDQGQLFQHVRARRKKCLISVKYRCISG